MDRKKLVDKFYAGLLAKNHSDQTPFLMEWFNNRAAELNKLPDQYDRSGIAKGDPLPIPKLKRFLALHEVVFRKIPLKDFCEVSGANYGVARHWRKTDEIFQEIFGEFAEEFSQAFFQRYTKQLESCKPEGFLQALRLVKECRHYPNILQVLVMAKLGGFGKRKIMAAAKVPNLDSLNLIRTHSLLFSTLLLSVTDKDAERREYAQELLGKEAEAFDGYFTTLREKYKHPEAQAALNLAEMRAQESIIYYTTIIKEFIG